MADIKQLPPLQALVFFEAAARHQNFTAAAQELGATQPAVSQRVSWLEEDLGVALFKRQHRGVALTAEGLRLFEAVREGLSVIGDATAELRASRSQPVLTVATDFGFAAYWLMPRLSALRELVPDLDVRIVTSQSGFDIRKEPVDVAISFGAGPWPGCEAEPLFPEVVRPVCSPAFAEQHGLTGQAAALSGLPLLHLEQPAPARWLSWPDWFALHGLPVSHGHHDLTFNNYPLVIQAAMIGQGVALGWSPLVDELLAAGQLLAAVAQPAQTERGYFLVWPKSARFTGALGVFRRWILAGAKGARL
jgi:putative choline sulfate-utilization transcription factor